jgi:hypothetical protein
MGAAQELGLDKGRPATIFYARRDGVDIPLGKTTGWTIGGPKQGVNGEVIVGEVLERNDKQTIIRVLASTLSEHRPDDEVWFPADFDQFVGGKHDYTYRRIQAGGIRIHRPIDRDTGRIASVEVIWRSRTRYQPKKSLTSSNRF